MEYSVQFSSVAQSCLTLCDPMNRSTPGLPVHHQHLEFTQTHVHRVSDAIQPSHCWVYTPRKPELKDTCTPMFIAALFIIARTWKQPRCPLADEWIRKLWYIYTMEYYSAIKKNTFESVLMRWMKLEPIIQSEVSQKEKHQSSILTHIYGI